MKEEHYEEEEGRKSPLVYIIASFLILLLILMIFPYYSVKLDPEPRNVPGIEIIPEFELENSTPVSSRQGFLKLINPSDPIIKQTADRIATSSCDSNRICYAKAIFYFVRDNFEYVSDPARFEYVKPAKESLLSKGGDCDDASVLLANLLQAIGIDTRFVFIPGHVYVQANMPDILGRYRDKEGWVNLDATCNGCSFGEIPYTTNDKPKTYLP